MLRCQQNTSRALPKLHSLMSFPPLSDGDGVPLYTTGSLWGAKKKPETAKNIERTKATVVVLVAVYLCLGCGTAADESLTVWYPPHRRGTRAAVPRARCGAGADSRAAPSVKLLLPVSARVFAWDTVLPVWNELLVTEEPESEGGYGWVNTKISIYTWFFSWGN